MLKIIAYIRTQSLLTIIIITYIKMFQSENSDDVMIYQINDDTQVLVISFIRLLTIK